MTEPRKPGLLTSLVHPDLDHPTQGRGPNDLGDSTQVHVGQGGVAGRQGSHGASLSPVIDRSATFHLDDAADEALATGVGGADHDIYGRYGCSTTRVAASLVARLEGAETAQLFASGTAATATVLATLVPNGATIAAAEGLYGGTQVLLRDEMPKRDVEVVRFAAADPRSLVDVLQQHRPSLVWCESIANPLIEVAALREIAAACRAAGALLGVDNTFAAGMAVRPLELGADLVMHSATKYLNGHSDVVAGAVCGSRALIDKLWSGMIRFGGCIDPSAAWLLARGMRTLPLRWARQCETASTLAQRLNEHAAIARVYYPGLPNHPTHAIARALLRDFGAMLSFELPGGAAAARAFVQRIRVCAHATSLGGFETLVSVPARSSHASIGTEARAALGIADGLIRVSVGLEDVDDLWADIEQALT